MEWQSEIRNEARNMMNRVDDLKKRMMDDDTEEARSAKNAIEEVNDALQDVVDSVSEDTGGGGLFS